MTTYSIISVFLTCVLILLVFQNVMWNNTVIVVTRKNRTADRTPRNLVFATMAEGGEAKSHPKWISPQPSGSGLIKGEGEGKEISADSIANKRDAVYNKEAGGRTRVAAFPTGRGPPVSDTSLPGNRRQGQSLSGVQFRSWSWQHGKRRETEMSSFPSRRVPVSSGSLLPQEKSNGAWLWDPALRTAGLSPRDPFSCRLCAGGRRRSFPA